MNQKERIKELERELKELKNVVKNDRIILTDPFNTNVQLVISIADCVVKVEKITTTNTEVSELIIKDNK